MNLSISLTPGTMLYKYELINRIAEGGFGDVWLAKDHCIKKEMAIKVLDASIVTIDERLKEAQIGNQLNHQNLVKVHYADIVNYSGNDLVIIAMDYHASGSILNRLNAGNFMPIHETTSFIIDILRGLEYLHELGIFHSDIKPKNILIGPNGEGILTDYGISCLSPTLSTVAPRSAYLQHMAPEVITAGLIGIHTDIYQVGMTAFRLLNGIGTIEVKLNSLGIDSFRKLVADGKVIEYKDYQSFVPINLKRIINKATQCGPNARYKSALEMRRALESLTYAGYWTCNSSGKLEGYNRGYRYRYEEIPLSGKLFNLNAYKSNISSNRETRITAFSNSRMSRKEVNELKTKFIQSVINGIL